LTKDSPTIGLLFGSVSSTDRDEAGAEVASSMHIIDATDAVYSFDPASDHLSLDMKQIKNKRDLWVQVYPSQPLLGWYAIGSEVTPRHLAVHREISSLVEGEGGRGAVMLLMNPVVQPEAKQLPLLLFELQRLQGGAEVFVERPFKVHVHHFMLCMYPPPAPCAYVCV
jgi:hypothetical protein